MENIMDDIAPVKVNTITNNQKVPLKQNPTVKLLKRECRKTERKWHKNKLQIHSIKRCFAHIILKYAKQIFFL